MSEQKKAPKQQQEQQQQQEDAESRSEQPEGALESRPDPEEQGDTKSGDSTASRGGGSAPAWLALLVSLAVAGLVGWQWWMARSDDGAGRLAEQVAEQSGAIDSLAQRVDELAERVESGASRLDSVSGQLESRDFDPAALRRQVRAQAEADADFEQQLVALSNQLEQSIAQVESQLEQAGAARSEGIEESLAEARLRLGLVEVAGLLRLGQAHVEMAGDPDVGIAAYRQAHTRLETIEDGRVSRLRELVADELEALRSVQTTDWNALAGRLAELESQSGQWPMGVADTRLAPESSETEAAGEEDGWWSSLRSSLGGLVRVTPRQAAPLTPAAVESVRERVRLHLAAAQVAVARRDGKALTRHLESTSELLRTHFDTSADAVSSALEVLSEAAPVASPSLPGLGGALAEAERRLGAS